MKNLKNSWNRLLQSLKKNLKRVKAEHLIREYAKNNVLFLVFVISCVINSTLLRFFCINSTENYLAIAPILADLAIITIVGGLGFLLKPKKKRTSFVLVLFPF